ncbi:hypothetical protein H0S56_08795 [Acinetobacter lwoffii]|uniref:DUF6176 family protein n=1 Tax=Acinetobacter lwoffii TaxID=28090 RepID=UPI00189ED867|nr:DUF6176 family protein [Acinetobacter lwoffii]QPF31170.1 hypothetical protein H0S56_08795 [Acinetobacter lwoffii]
MPLKNLKATGSGRFFHINHLYNDDTQKKIKIMDVGAVLIQLKPLHMQQVHDWQRTLKARQDEVIETLKAEQVHVESWFYLQLHGQDYLIAYMRADDIQKTQNIVKFNNCPIDQVHKQFKTSWQAVYPAELLLDATAT